MSDAWTFWRESVAGKKPEVTPGFPQVGYYIGRHYVSLPNAQKRTLVDFPVAIWTENDEMIAKTESLEKSWFMTRIEEIDDMFGQVCRAPISHERYLEMVRKLENYRNEFRTV